MSLLGIYGNKPGTYAIVDSDGKVIEYFRNKTAAMNYMYAIRKDYFEELKLVRLQ